MVDQVEGSDIIEQALSVVEAELQALQVSGIAMFIVPKVVLLCVSCA